MIVFEEESMDFNAPDRHKGFGLSSIGFNLSGKKLKRTMTAASLQG